MTFEELQKANTTIKTTPIKGKEYAEVNQRIKVFRSLFPMGSIETELLSNQGGVCIMRAIIRSEEGRVIGTGTAYERENSSNINKTSYIENCETSAVGRALAMVGIGIDTSVASAEEVENAIEQQNKPSAEVEKLMALSYDEALEQLRELCTEEQFAACQVEIDKAKDKLAKVRGYIVAVRKRNAKS